ncbi:MAG: hypothetical protein JST68_27750 [Bacteroidetes bacterium]|nr:hypothetical protein [Bacteroidota bacterium]
MSKTKKLPPARLRRLNIRLSQQEWDKIHNLTKNTTCRSVSEYARKVLSEKPVKVFYRNQSFDDFEQQMLQLRPLLEAFGDNIGQAIKKLQNPQYYWSELKPILAILLENAAAFSKTTTEINSLVEKLADQCDPKSQPHTT